MMQHVLVFLLSLIYKHKWSCNCFVFWYFSRVALLAGGDVLALLIFSAIGRFSHGFSVFDTDTLRTADPFVAGICFFLYLAF